MSDSNIDTICFMLVIVAFNYLFAKFTSVVNPDKRKFDILKIKMYLIGRYSDLRLKGEKLYIIRDFEIGEKLNRSEVNDISSFLDRAGYKMLGCQHSEKTTTLSIREWR